MELYKRSDLVYDDYSWTVYNNDDPKVSGEPDSTFLNRKEGYEILYFINKLADNFGFKSKASCEKIEKMIRKDVPSDIHSQKKIMEWIRINW